MKKFDVTYTFYSVKDKLPKVKKGEYVEVLVIFEEGYRAHPISRSCIYIHHIGYDNSEFNDDGHGLMGVKYWAYHPKINL